MKSCTGNVPIGIISLLVIFSLCIFVGKGITLSSSVPLIIIVSIFVFMLGFIQTKQMLFVLIFAMLLSPEISLGKTGSRDIVIRIEDLLIIVLFLAWMARTAMSHHEKFLFNTPIHLFIVSYASIFVLVTFYGVLQGNVRPLYGFFYILKYIEYFLIYYLVIALVKNKSQIKSYLKAIILTFFIVSIYAFIQVGSGVRVSAPFEGSGEPNTLGGYMVLILGVILGIVCHTKSRRWRFWLIGISVFSLIPFAQTLSRSSYLALIAMYLSLIFFIKSSKRNFLIGALFVVGILSIFIFPQSVKERILYTFISPPSHYKESVELLGVPLDSSSTERLVSWMVMFKRWQKHPFVGYGITSQGFIDSQYVRTLVEMGAVGFTAFLLLLISIAHNTYKIYKKAQDDILKGLAVGFLAGHIGMIFHAITANTYVLIRIMEPYWFLTALVMMILQVEKRVPAPCQEAESVINQVEKKGFNLRNSQIFLNGRKCV